MVRVVRRGIFRSWLLICLLAAAISPARAETLRDELQRFLHDDAEAVLHFRSYFLDRTNPAPPNDAAWAGGGWVGLKTGWFYDTFQMGAVGYTTQPLWAPPTTDGTQLLAPGQHGFFTLGQAYASLRAKGQTFTGYRQLLDELEVNPNDDRMIPNTFEAYALSGDLGRVRYFAGHVAAMKFKGVPYFVNMAARAGAPANVTAGMWLGSVKYGDIDKLRLRSSIYYVPDILTSNYNDIVVGLPITGSFKARFSGQFMVQGSNGLNLLTGKPLGTFAAGGKMELIWGPATLWGVFTQTGSAFQYQTPYGQWIGYTKQITKDFDRAGERAWQVGLILDFAAIDLPGLTFMGSATMGANAINPATGAPLSRNNEYDFDLIYQVASKSAPDWLKPLNLRARAAFVDQFETNYMTAISEYRLILNYELTWKGTRR
ncbi:MAG: outer membrane porin, OprD family [Rhodospirillales bacterium]|nr:outer membrane porin, OprD family [Rhodospirillales bacterium]